MAGRLTTPDSKESTPDSKELLLADHARTAALTPPRTSGNHRAALDFEWCGPAVGEIPWVLYMTPRNAR